MGVTLDMSEVGATCAVREDELAAVCDAVLAHEGVTRPCLVSVSAVDDDRMRDLNAEWRGADRPTDVLSLETERPDDPDLGQGEPCELGDIVLAPDYIARQAGRYGTTPADETRLLVVHGMLHLLGYDHMEEADAALMQPLEDAVIAGLRTDGTLGATVLTRHRAGEDE